MFGEESVIKREPMDIWSRDYAPVWSRKKTRKLQILTGRGCMMILRAGESCLELSIPVVTTFQPSSVPPCVCMCDPLCIFIQDFTSEWSL